MRIIPSLTVLCLLTACGKEVKAPAPEAQKPPAPEQVDANTCSDALDGIVPQGSYYLHISDIHLDDFGDTLSSKHPDTQPSLWTATQEALRSVIACRPPAFVLFTGDLPGHFDCGPGYCPIREPDDPNHAQFEHHAHNVHAVLEGLAAAAGTVPLLYLPGNNDSLGGDYFASTDAAGKTPFDGLKADYPAPGASKACAAKWSEPCTVDESGIAQGYYSARPIDGLRVIALNSVILGTKYDAMGGESQASAADTQLAWLEGQLSALEAGEKVLLAMHIPPGIDAYSGHLMWGPKGASPSPWQDRFVAAVDGASAAIVGIAYGHTHYDELRRMHRGSDESGPVIEIGISAPGITTNHGNRPGFKLVSFDANKELTDFVTLHSTAQATEFGTAHYRFRDFFPCTEGTPLLGCLAAMPDTNAVAQAAANIYYADPGKPGKASDIAKGIAVTSKQAG